MTFFIPVLLAPIAIVTGVIAKGQERRARGKARQGIILGSAAIIINITLLASSLVSVFRNPEMRASVNEVTEQMYGITFEDTIRDFDRVYGTDFSSLFVYDEASGNTGTDAAPENDAAENDPASEAPETDEAPAKLPEGGDLDGSII